MRPHVPAAVRSLAAGLALGLLAQRASAQVPPAPHDPQTSMLPDAKGAVAWSLLSRTAIRKVDGRLGPDFPLALKPLNGRTVKLQGYILPLEAGPSHSRFKVKVKDNRYAAPGIYDDGRGLASLLTVVRALNQANIRTVGDIVFVGTVGEEELGDLRGVKTFFREQRNVDGFISFDGIDISRIVNRATGSRRWRIVYTGPGGHSFSAFGLPSATHALGRAIARIAEVRTPDNPRTTFTVGTLKGGTSVNAIAAEAELGLDMRSNSAEELRKLEEKLLQLAREAAAEENARWGQKDVIKVDFKLVGDRPAGAASMDSAMLHAARKGVAAAGGEVKSIMASSTDSNLPVSLGIPAVTLGSGGVGGGSHGPGEWYSPVNAWLGPQSQLLTIVSLVGGEGVTLPVLPKR